MATTTQYVRGTNDSVMTTGLNSLANNALVSQSYTPTTAGYLLCEVELVVTFGTNPTANTGVSIWLLRETDGSDVEDGSSSFTPARAPDLVIPVRVTTSAQRLVGVAQLPPSGTFTVLLKNDGTGQAFAASGNTLKIRPLTTQQA